MSLCEIVQPRDTTLAPFIDCRQASTSTTVPRLPHTGEASSSASVLGASLVVAGALLLRIRRRVA